MTDLYTYDIETYPNCFTFACERYSDKAKWVFEISWRRDQSQELYAFLKALVNTNARMVGFNNVGFDYPVIHDFMKSNGLCGYEALYDKAMKIIRYSGDPFMFMVWPSDRFVSQVDLYKINHFDNVNRRTGLKQIEFNMRVPDLKDLPFPPGTMLTSEQIDVLIDYNMNGDVVNTREFLTECIPALEFRDKLSAQYDRDFTNHNDTKVGKDYFIMSLEQHGVPCYEKGPNGREPRQTHGRFPMQLKDAVFPYVKFQYSEFERIHQYFLSKTITETKGVFKDLKCTINNFTYKFGLGGIHGSVESQTVNSDDYWMIEDWDVASYYPNLAIKNKLFPAHLSEKFCDIYQDVYEQRKQHPKGSPENAVMKLALNGVYGDSNSRFSPFYDPLYTMTITINGQLLLCMLAEQLQLSIEGLSMIQINTDGLTVRYPRHMKECVHTICKAWEQFTCLTLEDVEYRRMFIRDVNSYIGEYTDGKLKRKGAYAWDAKVPMELPHNKDHSALVVPKAAERVLVHGEDIVTAVTGNADIMDFMLRVKAKGVDKLLLDEAEQQKTCRYYVSQFGGRLTIVRPPPKNMKVGDYKKANGVSDDQYATLNQTGVHNLEIHTKNQSVYGSSTTEVEKGWTVTVANDIMQATNRIDFNYYINEVRKLVEPLR